jgi:hypothetical protein
MIKPGEGALDIFTPTKSMYKHLTRKDIIIVHGGSIDVYRNNTKLALIQIMSFCEELNCVNMIFLTETT